jgi:hypothetical protein
MITKNNNFLVKSLTKNLMNNQSQDSNKNLLPKKNGNMHIKSNSKAQEQQQILQQQNQEQYNFTQVQQQRIQHRQLMLHKERDKLIQQQQEQQRILQQQQEQQRILQQQHEQQRILQQRHEQQRILQHQHEQQRILQHQLEQQQILQEQQRIIQKQREQEQQQIIQKQKEEEQQRIIQRQQDQQEINTSQSNLNLPLFGKNKKNGNKGNINMTQQQQQQKQQPQKQQQQQQKQQPQSSNNNISTFSSALSDYKIKKNSNKGTLKMDIINDSKKMFQNMCLSHVNIFPRHLLQNVQSNGENEAILIEFRILPHVEFIIKNAIIKLGDSFAHTIVCGNENYLLMKQICDDISPNIKIIKLEKNNITINEYNNLFYDLSFWEKFYGNKLLFYQEDTIIFKNNIRDFLQYDYVGAPWNLDAKNSIFPSVGNGGFSLRDRNILMDILRNKVEIHDFNFANKKHKSGEILDNIPEDIFFSLTMLKLNIGNVPEAVAASYFSTENIVNKDSLGGHQFWLNDASWADRMNALFQEYRNG